MTMKIDTMADPANYMPAHLQIIGSSSRFDKLLRHAEDGAGWYGWDFDRTLVKYDRWRGADHYGENIQAAVDALIQHLDKGDNVKIFTARIHPILSVSLYSQMSVASGTSTGEFLVGQEAVRAVQRWCMSNLGHPLEITCVKDARCIAIYDDIAIQVVPNEGRRADGQPFHPPA
jgi:hypothetical protein